MKKNAVTAKAPRETRALMIFLKCAQRGMHYADCHPRAISAVRRMDAMRPIMEGHPNASKATKAVHASRIAVLRGL